MNNEEVDHYEGSACETIDKLTAKINKAIETLTLSEKVPTGSYLKAINKALTNLKGEENENTKSKD